VEGFEISFGAWAIGSAWGSVDDAESLAALEKAIDCGVNFIDTATSTAWPQRAPHRAAQARAQERSVATKAAAAWSAHRRRLQPQEPAAFVEDQPQEPATDAWTWCSCTAAHRCYYTPEVFGRSTPGGAGKIRYYA